MSITDKSSITQYQNRVHPQCETSDPRVAFFDHHAPMWDADTGEVERTLQRLDVLKNRLGLRAGQDVLELGCGTGRVTGWLADNVCPGCVVAADFSPAMLTQARARGVPAEFRLMDICGDGVEGGLFDVVFCFHAFPHFRDQLRALANIRSLLKSTGQLIVLHLVGSAHLNAFHAALPHPVCHDLLPSNELWPEMLAWTDLQLVSLADETDLFLLKATPSES